MENPKSLFNSRVKSWFFGRQWFLLSLIFATFLMTNYTVNAQVVYQGTAPVQSPSGGHEVEGNAYSDTPTAGVGDWFYDGSGTGGGIIGSDGLPLDTTMTTFTRDGLSGDATEPDLTTFIGGAAKVDDDPNTYQWGGGTVPQKNEIQNTGVHFSWGDDTVPGVGVGGVPFVGDPNDLWCIFAADRMVTNGNSYIDFEFLQNTLTMDTGGGFTSLGPDGGRTVGDFLLTIELTNGGALGNVVLNKWEVVGNGYDYILKDIGDFAPNTIFATNNTVYTEVPFPAYDQVVLDPNTGLPVDPPAWYYNVNQWVEGAVNLTQVLNVVNDPCFNYTVATVFIRTKSSASATAALKDIAGPPIQANINLNTLK